MNKFFSLSALFALFVIVACKDSKNNNGVMNDFEAFVLEETASNARSIDLLIGMTPEITKECAPDSTFPLSINSFLIKTAGQNILIDAGMGENIDANLQKYNLAPDSITAILITHVHYDHIAGLLKDGKPRFAKAQLYMSIAERNYFMDDEAMNALPEANRFGFLLARTVQKEYADRLTFFTPIDIEAEQKTALFANIYAFDAYGHTPGHTAYMLESDKDKLLIWGDLVHAVSIQMAHPEIAIQYDVNPEEAIKSRSRILKYVADNNIRIGGMHLPSPSMGKVQSTDKGQYKLIVND